MKLCPKCEFPFASDDVTKCAACGHEETTSAQPEQLSDSANPAAPAQGGTTAEVVEPVVAVVLPEVVPVVEPVVVVVLPEVVPVVEPVVAAVPEVVPVVEPVVAAAPEVVPVVEPVVSTDTGSSTSALPIDAAPAAPVVPVAPDASAAESAAIPDAPAASTSMGEAAVDAWMGSAPDGDDDMPSMKTRGAAFFAAIWVFLTQWPKTKALFARLHGTPIIDDATPTPSPRPSLTSRIGTRITGLTSRIRIPRPSMPSMPSRRVLATVGIFALLCLLVGGTFLLKPWTYFDNGKSEKTAVAEGTTDKAPVTDTKPDAPKKAEDKVANDEPKAPAADYVATECMVVLNLIEEGQAIDAMRFEGVCPVGLKWSGDSLPVRRYSDMGGRVYLLDLSRVDWERPSQKIALMVASAK